MNHDQPVPDMPTAQSFEESQQRLIDQMCRCTLTFPLNSPGGAQQIIDQLRAIEGSALHQTAAMSLNWLLREHTMTCDRLARIHAISTPT